jgi:hypothetical protein
MQRARKLAVATAGVLSALGVAAPISTASAATTTPNPFAGFQLPSLGALPTFPTFPTLPTLPTLPGLGTLPSLAGFTFPTASGVPLSFIGPSVGFVGVAIGPTVINSVFNGATVVQVVNGPAGSSVIGSP